jgi:hypothetical protein
MVAERGIGVCYEASGDGRPALAQPMPIGSVSAATGYPDTSLSPSFPSYRCQGHHQWRVVGEESAVLEALMLSKRSSRAAPRLLQELLKRQGLLPDTIVNVRLLRYGAALLELGLTNRHKFGGCEND